MEITKETFLLLNESTSSLKGDIANWLKAYPNEIVMKVIDKYLEKIVSDAAVRKMLYRLSVAEQQEKQAVSQFITDKVDGVCFCGIKSLGLAKTYRDVLADLYINHLL